ncbi:MAG: hypothetical protein ACTHN0_13015 [Aquihabitans sp.]
MRRTATLLLALVGALVLLTGCVPKPVPIEYDGVTTTSKAEWRVAAVTTSKGPGIEVRFRNCSTVHFTSTSPVIDQLAHLRPVVRVTDSKGKVIFDNASPISEVRPAGSQVIDTSTPTTDDLQRIVVPTAGAAGALTIDPQCTTSKGYGSGGGYAFDLKPCTTTTRSCATRKAGTSIFDPGS